MDMPINQAEYIPATGSGPSLSYGPISMCVPGRKVDLELRVAMPAEGDHLPIVLLSHGHGSSIYLSSARGYDPLLTFYAAHGFVVIQPTHQDSKALGLDPGGPEGALFWRSRVTDMHWILDHLAEIEALTPGLAGRMDHDRIAAVGHSMGGHTVAMLAGMSAIDPVSGQKAELSDRRIKAGVMLAPPGDGADLAPFATEHYPILRNNDFSRMTAPALVVAGDQDQNDQFSKRQDWRADAYALSPGPKCLLTLYGAKHSQGGVSGWDVREATDEDPERLGVVQRLTWAYLRTQIYPGDQAWEKACAALAGRASPLGRVNCK